MCRLYVAVNDSKGNKIHRHGSNNWDNINREFINCLLNYKNRRLKQLDEMFCTRSV